MSETTETIDLTDYLSHGKQAELARKYDKTRAYVHQVAKGRIDNPKIYSDLLKDAEQQIELQKLRDENTRKAKELVK